MQPKIYNMNINLKCYYRLSAKIFSTDTDPVYKYISQNINFDHFDYKILKYFSA